MEQKTMQCIKCQKDVLVQNGVNTPNGFVCNDCIKKERVKKIALTIGGILLVVIVGLAIYFSQSRNSAVGFEGVTDIQDSVYVSVQQPVAAFSLENTVAQANPVVAGQTVDNIASFKRQFEENVQKAKEANDGSVIIPNISVLFEFDSSVMSSVADALLEEYAKAYLQTNRQAIILVEGFACNAGTDAVNNWLSEQRAKNVQQLLVESGIPCKNIEVKWYGKSRNKEFSYPSAKEYRRVIVSVK